MQQAVVSGTSSSPMEILRLPRRQPGVGRAPKPRVRADSLPEFTRYRDDGCDVSASCLDCPLPRCRYEEPGGLRALLNEQRDRQILQLRLKGMPVDQLAGRFGVSRRTVFRVIGTTKLPPRPHKQEEDFAPIPIRRDSIQKEAHVA